MEIKKVKYQGKTDKTVGKQSYNSDNNNNNNKTNKDDNLPGNGCL